MANIQSAVDTFNLLAEGDRTIKLSANKNITLVLGKTGSGKTTLVQYIAGDNEQLFSKRVGSKFIIEDKQERISSGTISRTIFPALVVDSKTNADYYDCPGFADNRDVSMDIASTYFIKKIIDYADAVKIVLTVGDSAISIANDRGEYFKSLLEHTTSLIKNIDKFKDSISLVVTKVPNEYYEDDEGNLILVSDNAKIYDIANFLKGLKPELKDVSPFKDNPILYVNSLMLIDLLLTREGVNYQKIAIFRMPTKEGPISKIKKLQVGKRHIINMIQKNTQFTAKDDNDFSYTVSDMSKNNIHNLVELLNEKITSNVTKIGEEIREHYRIIVEQSTDLHKLQSELANGYNILSNITKINATSVTTQTLIMEINSITNALEINISKDSLSYLKDSENYLKLFKAVSKQPLVTRSFQWVYSLSKAVKYLSELSIWYKFLTDLYVKLSTYDIQKDISKYNVANLADLKLGGRKQGITIHQNNVREFLTKLDQIGLGGYNNLKDIEIKEPQLNALNEVLRITLKQNAQTICLPDKLIVKGNFVKFGEISIVKCGKIKWLEVHALNTVFIDKDFDLVGKQFNFVIIAPKWEVIGTRRINLDGAPGKYQDKAKSATTASGEGSDGKPGLPGGSAGNLLGIGKEFINGQNLTISANGGLGGPGQKGGNGGDGKRGETPSSGRDYDSYDRSKIGERTVCQDQFTIAYFCRIAQDEIYEIYGKAGGPGGDGGHGGSGGLGGIEGQITILKLAGALQVPNIMINNQPGSLGMGGEGGEGGKRGRYGDIVRVAFMCRDGWFSTNCFWGDVERTVEYPYSYSTGTNGNNNYITTGRQQLERIKFQNLSHTINNYKSFLLENLHNSVIKQSLTQFIDQLNSNDQVRGIYDTLGLIHEFQSLENQFNKIKVEIELMPFYQSLLTRISKYVTLPQDNEKSMQHKKVLKYLYTATLSKIISLKNELDGNLIIDMRGYLNSAISTINELPKISKEIAIEKRNKEYNDAINKKIDEANDFIDTQITSEFNNIGEQIDGKIELLLNETVQLQEQAEEEKKQLVNKKRELEGSLQSGLIFSILKGIGQVASFLGPWGNTAGQIIGATSMVAESFTLDNASPKEVAIQQGVIILLLEAEKSAHLIRDKKLAVLDRQLEILSQERSKFPNELNDTISLITYTKAKLTESSKDDQLNSTKISSLERELKEHLESKKQKVQRASKVIERLKQASQIGEISADIYLKYKNDQSKLDQIQSAINQVQGKIDQLKEYERNIYNTMIPILTGIRKDINELQSTLDSKSQVALDVAKWQIQSSIRDVKLQMNQFTAGFQIQENLARCIDKLDETMSVMINIYDRIQNYHDQKRLADYIADVSSPASNSIIINDVELNSAINNLELIIKYNIILDQYEIVVNGFFVRLDCYTSHSRGTTTRSL